MRLASWAATLALWAAIAAGGVGLWAAADLPDIDEAIAATRKPTVTLLAADGTELAAFGDLYAEPRAVRELPRYLIDAVIATEDRRFFRHFGLDPVGLVRALIANARAGRIVQGGSTITQQVAKNLFLTPERSIKRKVQEVLLALWLERRFAKDQILTLYLNRVYFGAGTYGVEAAARRYFAVPAPRLSLYQSAMLAGLLKAPSRYDPQRHPDLAQARAGQVLANMVDAGRLGARDAETAARGGSRFVAAAPGRGLARHFADWVLDEVASFVSPGDRDLVVRTTLDVALQRAVEDATGAMLAGPAAAARASEAAVVVLTAEGAVRALVGGRDYRASQFNRAVQALRQPGSAFKPFVYLAGLEAGLTPETRLVDAPLRIAGWQPANFDDRYRGEVTVRDALAYSINTVAAQIGQRAGPERVAAVARRLGITSTLAPTPSLALGTSETSLLELTAAYGAIASGGFALWAHAIEEIRERGGRVLYRRGGSGPARVVAPEHVAAIHEMMQAVIAYGTGRAAALARPAAGKTGTSQDFRDAWFLGYTSDFVAGVWMGNDDGEPMRGVTGGGLPARLWREVMVAAHRGREARPLVGTASAEGFWDGVLARIGGGRR